MSSCGYKEPEPQVAEYPDLPEGVPPLRSFYLYLSTSCNLACRHCWITPRFVNGQSDPGDVIDVTSLRAAIAEAKPMGLSSVKLTGGEPLLHPDFQEICELVTKEELLLTMETNGTLLTAELARYLKNDSSMANISVSIDSCVAARHDSYRGVQGAFTAVLRGLDYLVAAGYDNVQVIMSVHRGNRNEIEAVSRLASSHGAASIKFSPVAKCGRGADMGRRGETLDFAEHMALNRYVYNELASHLRADGIALELILNTPPALMPINEIIRRRGNTGDCGVLGILGILGSGEIALCGIGRNIPDLVYGHLGEDSIRTIWLQHPTIITLRQVLADMENYPPICRDCTFAKHCRTGCVAENYIDGRNLVWPDALCTEASSLGLFPVTRQKIPMQKNIHTA